MNTQSITTGLTVLLFLYLRWYVKFYIVAIIFNGNSASMMSCKFAIVQCLIVANLFCNVQSKLSEVRYHFILMSVSNCAFKGRKQKKHTSLKQIFIMYVCDKKND